jgi:molybdenum cofactor synthesis domain-containing protein
VKELSHVDAAGSVRMVDVGEKPVSRRRAVARASVRMAAETARMLRELPKGDALATAQVAGIMAAKRTAELIPLCHPLPISHVDLTIDVREERVEMKAAVLTVSDGVAAGEREDESGDLLDGLLAADGYEVERRVVADDREAIADAIVELAEDAVLVLTTGGTGLGPRDVTPEATAEVLDREAPGIAEAIRADSASKTPHGLLSRGVTGTRDRTLVVNLPGSPGGCRDGFAILQPALRHALELLVDEPTAHRQT